jgi:hypothetical protein
MKGGEKKWKKNAARSRLPRSRTVIALKLPVRILKMETVCNYLSLSVINRKRPATKAAADPV